METNKKAIAHSFSRAAKNYDNFAKFQQKSGQYLFDNVSSISGNIILDAGCGTGYFSQQWQLLGKQVIALDLSIAMLEIAKQKKAAMSYIQGDIELLPLKDEKVDFCFSHLAIQWCSNIFTPLSELYRITKKGGVIVFSTLVDGSLKELKKCWENMDNLSHVNSFLSFNEIEIACKPWVYSLEQQSWYLMYPSFNSLLQSLKGIGATYLSQGRQFHGLMTKNHLTKLIEFYPHINNEFPLTYELVFGILYRE